MNSFISDSRYVVIQGGKNTRRVFVPSRCNASFLSCIDITSWKRENLRSGKSLRRRILNESNATISYKDVNERARWSKRWEKSEG